MQDSASLLGQAKPKAHLSHMQWPSALKIKIPEKYRPGSSRRSRSKKPRRQVYDDSTRITKLQTSFNPFDGVRAARRHRWHWLDIQYPALAGFMFFSLSVAPMPLIFKIGIPLVSLLVCLMPTTRQFFLPSMPIWIYLLYFFCSRFIPVRYRPHIWVKVLPALENVLYGANLSRILSAHTHPILDVVAWLPYGLGHFGAPAVCSLLIFIFCAPGSTPVFARSFGWLALTGVTLSLLFPCTPPWYEKEHGLEPAHYGMSGSPAGLARVDKLLGVDMYTTSFTTAPMPFGAFPSLHAGNATLEALFLGFCFPRLRALWFFYAAWLCWATMYLNHHYAVDLVAGALLAVGIYAIASTRFMPRQQFDKRTRWAYEYVEIGEKARNRDEEYGFLDGKEAEITGHVSSLLELRSSDEWTIVTTPNFSSTTSSPRTSTTSPSLMSPTTPDEEAAHHVVVPMNVNVQLVWEGEPVQESELCEVILVR